MTHYLYSFRRCPYAMRARMALFVAQIPMQIEDILLKDKPTRMLELSPKGTVPVLQLKTGQVIDESLEIIEWALGQNDPENWLEYSNAARQLIDENDGSFKKALDRYKYPVRYPDEDCSGARDICEAFLQKLDDQLASYGGYLAASHRTLIDIAIFPFIRQCANTDRVWFDALNMPHLHKWLDMNLESTLFKQIMEKPKEKVTSYFLD